MAAGIKEVRDRIGSVKNTKKITDAMKLVAAAKVRRGTRLGLSERLARAGGRERGGGAVSAVGMEGVRASARNASRRSLPQVRRAQEAVVNGRPFAENLVKARARGLGAGVDRARGGWGWRCAGAA